MGSEMCIRDSYIGVQVDSEVLNIKFKEPQALGECSYSTVIVEIINSDDKDYVKYEKVLESHGDWLKERRNLNTEITTVLNSVNTTKQLIEVWPEVEKFLPAHIADPNTGIKLPALKVSRLNEKLGIVG